jgi:hypothetical protein
VLDEETVDDDANGRDDEGEHLDGGTPVLAGSAPTLPTTRNE